MNNTITTRAVFLSVVMILSVVAIGAVGSAAAANDTATDTLQNTDTEIEFGTNSSSTTSNETHTTVLPALSLSDAVEIDHETAIEIENTNTGDAVTISLSEEEDEVVGHDVMFIGIYDVDGEVRGHHQLAVGTSDGEHAEIGVNVTGDMTTFSQNSQDTYQITLLQDDEVVDSTSEHILTIGHEKQFDSTVTDEYVEYSFNAGELPTDGEIRASLSSQIGDNWVRSHEVSYDEEAHRFTATFDRDEVPDDAYRASISVLDPDTEFHTARLADDLTVGDAEDPEGIDISVQPADETVVTGEEIEVDIVVSGADEGISAYDIDVGVDGQGQFTDFETTQSPDFDANEIQNDGTLLNLEAGMGANVYDPAGEIVIASATIDADDVGSINVEVGESAVADVDNAQYDVGETRGAVIDVIEEPEGPSEPVSGDDLPQDLNGDGLYEDITGDGELTVFDVQALFSNLDSEAVQENPEAFNFSGDDDPEDVTVFDVQALFNQIE